MDETEEITADQLKSGMTIKHPDTGEWVTGVKVEKFGTGISPAPLTEQEALTRELNIVEFDTGTEVLRLGPDQMVSLRL